MTAWETFLDRLAGRRESLRDLTGKPMTAERAEALRDAAALLDREAKRLNAAGWKAARREDRAERLRYANAFGQGALVILRDFGLDG